MPFYPGISITTHLRETGGPTVLPIGAVALNEYLCRVAGDKIEGAAAVGPATIDIGPPDTVGSWRIINDINSIIFERCDSVGPVVYAEYWRQTK